MKNCATETICPGRHCGKLAGGGRFFVIREIQRNQCLVAGSEYGARGGTKMCTGLASPLKLAACRLQHADMYHRPQQFIQQFGSQALMIGKLLKRRPWHKKCWIWYLLCIIAHNAEFCDAGREFARSWACNPGAILAQWAVNFVWIFMIKLLKWPRIQVGSAATHKAIVWALDGHGVHPKFVLPPFATLKRFFLLLFFRWAIEVFPKRRKTTTQRSSTKSQVQKYPGIEGGTVAKLKRLHEHLGLNSPKWNYWCPLISSYI